MISETSPENLKSFARFREIIHFGLTEAERFLIENPDAIRARNRTGETIVHYFDIENDLPVVSWLVEHGAKLTTGNYFGSSLRNDIKKLGLDAMEDLVRRLIAERSGAEPDT